MGIKYPKRPSKEYIEAQKDSRIIKINKEIEEYEELRSIIIQKLIELEIKKGKILAELTGNQEYDVSDLYTSVSN